jgi:hypothetical protein
VPERRDPFLIRLAARFEGKLPPGESIIASGQEIDLSSTTAVATVLARRQRWQYQALDATEACPQVSYGISQLAGAISRLRFYVADKPKLKDAPPDPTTNEQAAGIIDQLGSVVDRAMLQFRITEQFLITGEPYLIYIKSKDAWEVRSIEEVFPASFTMPDGTSRPSIAVKDSPQDSQPVVLAPSSDTWIRLLHQSPRWSSLATSQLKPLLDIIDELVWWSNNGLATVQNRLAVNGALGVPNSLEAPIESEEDAKFSGSERFIRKWYERGLATIRNPGKASAKLPFLFSYPDNDQRKSGLEFIDMHRTSDDLMEKRVATCLQAIAQGMNLPPEVVLGMQSGSGSSHFTLQAIEESLFIQHVEPVAILIVHALTQAFLRPVLRKMGVADPNDYLVWYDASNLMAKPDMSQAADFGVQNVLINGEWWRKTRNFPESAKPSPEEAAAMIEILQVTRGRIPPGGGQDGSVNPSDNPELPPATPDKTIVPGEHPPKQQDAVTARGKGKPAITKPIAASSNGHRTDADVLLAQLQILGDEKVRRALEKAGNKLRSRANKNTNYKNAIKSCASEDIARTLGREACTKLGIDDLFDGCFDTTAAQFRVLASSVEAPMKECSMRFVDGLKLIAAEKLFTPLELIPVVSMAFIEDCFDTKERV